MTVPQVPKRLAGSLPLGLPPRGRPAPTRVSWSDVPGGWSARLTRIGGSASSGQRAPPERPSERRYWGQGTPRGLGSAESEDAVLVVTVRFGIGRPRAYRPARPSRADPVDPMACAGWPAEPGRAGHRWRFECMLGPRLWPTQGQSRAKQWRMAFRGWSPPALRFRSKWIGAIARGALHDRGVAAIVRSSGVRRIESVAGPVCLAHRV